MKHTDYDDLAEALEAAADALRQQARARAAEEIGWQASPTRAIGQPPMLMRVEEAADELRVGRTVVYELIRVGALRSIRIGRARRISREALRDFVAEQSARQSS